MLSLAEWTQRIKSLHVTDMDLSLERVKEVAHRLNLLSPSYTTLTVGGTNGKGSCVAGLEAIYCSQGYRVGSFTTPFLFKPNEQIKVNGRDISDEQFCQAYQMVDTVRDKITLTPFEFNALAALIIFSQQNLDVVILEVGLGGRWDAVNIIDADLAIITSIGIDHVEWLGDTRESIAREKAGIFRSNKPVVCGDFDPPVPLIEIAAQLHAPFYNQAKDFGFEKLSSNHWKWWSKNITYTDLPLPKLALQNMATVLKAIELMQERLPVSYQSIYAGLAKVNLTGRIQVVPGKVQHIFDVSHNPASAEFLAAWLRENPIKGKTYAVFSMLKDKDMVSTLSVIKDCIDDWYIAPINEIRGTAMDVMQNYFKQAGMAAKSFATLTLAYKALLIDIRDNDRIVVFGSFRTVAEVALCKR